MKEIFLGLTGFIVAYFVVYSEFQSGSDLKDLYIKIVDPSWDSMYFAKELPICIAVYQASLIIPENWVSLTLKMTREFVYKYFYSSDRHDKIATAIYLLPNCTLNEFNCENINRTSLNVLVVNIFQGQFCKAPPSPMGDIGYLTRNIESKFGLQFPMSDVGYLLYARQSIPPEKIQEISEIYSQRYGKENFNFEERYERLVSFGIFMNPFRW